jgi:hypothetical protein
MIPYFERHGAPSAWMHTLLRIVDVFRLGCGQLGSAELTLSTEVVFRERPPRSLHFALSHMNITVRSKIMSNIGRGLNELWGGRNDHYGRLFVQRDSIRVHIRSSYHPHLLVPRLPISRSW